MTKPLLQAKQVRNSLLTISLLFAFAGCGLCEENALSKLGLSGMKAVSTKRAKSVRGKGGFSIPPISVARSVNIYGTVGTSQAAGVNFATARGFSFEKVVGTGFATAVAGDVRQSYGIGRTVSYTFPGYSKDIAVGNFSPPSAASFYPNLAR